LVLLAAFERACVFVIVAVFWDVTPYSQYVSKRFKGTYRLHLQGRKVAEHEASIQHVSRQILGNSIVTFFMTVGAWSRVCGVMKCLSLLPLAVSANCLAFDLMAGDKVWL
jgi:hypothetical protein